MLSCIYSERNSFCAAEEVDAHRTAPLRSSAIRALPRSFATGTFTDKSGEIRLRNHPGMKESADEVRHQPVIRSDFLMPGRYSV